MRDQEVSTRKMILIAPVREDNDQDHDLEWADQMRDVIAQAVSPTGRFHAQTWLPDGDDGFAGLTVPEYRQKVEDGSLEVPEAVVKGRKAVTSTDNGWGERAENSWREKLEKALTDVGTDERIYPILFL